MTSFLTVIAMALVSLVSQLNLKYVSGKLFVDTRLVLPSNKWYLITLTLQAGLPAIISLAVTIYGYSRFPFYQFMIFQTLYFVFAMVTDLIVLGGQFSWRSIFASGLILLGIALATIP